MTVKSVYNFVPAPEEKDVFKPDWAKQVSQDIPFSDGESGEIELTIKAETPIFIRNGHSKMDAEIHEKYKKGELTNPTDKERKAIERYLEFSNLERNGKKQYFIPGSSLKGMIRNVLEIISKSRLSQIQNHRHSVRQIMKPKGIVVDEGYDLKDKKAEINAGWLIYQDGKHYIYDCGKPFKIRHTDLDSKIDTDFENYFKKGGKAKLDDDFSARTARYKYKTFNIDYNKTYTFEEHPLDENDKQKSWVSKFQKLKYVRFTNSDFESFLGHIVCVGQASDYNNKTARKSEYVFTGNKNEILNNPQNRYEIKPEDYEDFLFVNRHNKNDELEDWTYLKRNVNAGIPVFFRKKEKEKVVEDFGIPFMYKQPTKYSVKDLKPYITYRQKQLDNDKFNYDLSETIFGTTNNDHKNKHEKTLKGRVFFAHMKCLSNIDENSLKKENVIMGSPRSSFFPFYLKQFGRNGVVSKFNTYNNESELSGFKRYYVHKTKNNFNNLIEEKSKMVTEFIPLPKGTVFKGKIRYHNLKKAEIGALLSAITFHNQTDKTFHSLGYAKPFGLGKVKININYSNSLDYIKEFEFEIRKKIKNWDISELISLAMESNQEIDYMELKDFQKVKDKGLYLQPFRQNNIKFRTISDDEIDDIKQQEIKQQEIIRNKKEEQFRKEKELELKPYKDAVKLADKYFKEEKWKEAYNQYLQAIELKDDEDYPKRQKNMCKDKIDAKKVLQKGLNIPVDLNDFNSGKQIISEFYKSKGGKYIEGDNAAQIKRFIQCCIQRSPKRWKKFGVKDWKLVEKWVGKDIAQQWFDEFIKS
ncbi:MAG: TIGR03986 family CRISPR-associated RAMP protein [Bacteroidota bacterium]|nr:TIGR03986 family CRISPR-associated RAMP protein [Bacteroidota bacterium]